jgi:hypothetical protein
MATELKARQLSFSVSGYGRVPPTTLFVGGVRSEFLNAEYCLDAPDLIPAGSCWAVDETPLGDFAACRRFDRDRLGRL